MISRTVVLLAEAHCIFNASCLRKIGGEYLLSSDSKGISSIASGGMDVGVSVGGQSHYGDA